jgi:uncharacterized alkaline shock family protein YloU
MTSDGDGTGPGVSELAFARAVRYAVQRVPGIRGLSGGAVAEVATYGPGEIVRGVVVSRQAGALAIAVHVIALYADGLVLPELAAHVRQTVQQVVIALTGSPAQRVDVSIDDLHREEPLLR